MHPIPAVDPATLPPTGGESAASRQYAELAGLAGQLIHEIKNHLGTLDINLQLLGEELAQPETQKERRALRRVQKLQGECRRLAELSNDFLRFAHAGELHREACDLKEILEEMADFHGPTARQAGIDIKLFLPASLPRVAVDRELFKQALLNLILNACQAMPHGGQLTIQAETRPREVWLSFIDTGVGMPPEIQEQIFKPFFTTRTGGSGLGLSTTRKIVEAHGGTIEVQSAVGKGTKFTLRLPV
jgi:two-component system sensor histidine kinase HydH